MRFTKMHGAGNDYIYIDCFNNAAPARPRRSEQSDQRPPLWRWLRRAHSDLPLGKGRRPNAHVHADGSESEMCGNGIRCLAKYAYDHALTRNNPMNVETGRGVLALQLELRQGKVERVTVDMGEPILDAAAIPTTIRAVRVVDVSLPEFPVNRLWNAWEESCGLAAKMNLRLDGKSTCCHLLSGRK